MEGSWLVVGMGVHEEWNHVSGMEMPGDDGFRAFGFQDKESASILHHSADSSMLLWKPSNSIVVIEYDHAEHTTGSDLFDS